MTRPPKARDAQVFDSRPQPFDAWWNTITDDQRRNAHDSIGHEINDALRESFVEADIALVEAHLSDGDGGHRPVWLMPTAIADFIAERWQDQATTRGAEQFRLNARKVLDEFVADHRSSQVDAPVTAFTTDDGDDPDREPEAHPSVHGNATREGTGIDAQSFDLPTYE